MLVSSPLATGLILPAGARRPIAPHPCAQTVNLSNNPAYRSAAASGETHCSTHIEPILRGHKGIEEGVADLVELANEQNGHDNITALVVKLKVKPDLSKLQSV